MNNLNDNTMVFFGLGNPAGMTPDSRHQAGHMVLDEFIAHYRQLDASLAHYGHNEPLIVHRIDMSGDLYDVYSFMSNNTDYYLVYVLGKDINHSGEAIRNFFDRNGTIPVQNMVVFYDDINIDIGMLRVKNTIMHSGGHNGIKSIMEHFNTGWIGCRVGVGKPSKDADLFTYVTGQLDADTLLHVKRTAAAYTPFIMDLTTGNFTKLQNAYSGKLIK